MPWLFSSFLIFFIGTPINKFFVLGVAFDAEEKSQSSASKIR